MKKLFAVALAMLVVSMPVFAISSMDTSDLTKEQRDELELKMAQLKVEAKKEAAPENMSQRVREEAQAWSSLGTNVGQAMVSTAKELGVAANDFVKTPIGKWTMVIIVYKLVGQQLIHLAGIVLMLTASWTLGLYVMFRATWGADLEYEYKPVFWGMWQKRCVLKRQEDNDWRIWKTVIGLAIIVLSVIISLSTL